jgi:hypothetical protein
MNAMIDRGFKTSEMLVTVLCIGIIALADINGRPLTMETLGAIISMWGGYVLHRHNLKINTLIREALSNEPTT